MVVTSNNSSSKENINAMEDKESVKKSTILEIFQTMDYGQSFENVDKATDWIKSKEGKLFAYIDNVKEAPNGIQTQLKNDVSEQFLCTVYVPEIDTIKKILSKTSKVKWIDTQPFERAKMLNKLAIEIEKNAELLSQIEIVSRGILGKDTRNKAIPLLAQYFYYYSSFAVTYSKENPNWKPEGIALGIISNANTLSNIGLMLAPALAAGYNIVLQVGTRLTPAATFILELAKNIGIPEEIIRLIPSDDYELLPSLSSDNVAILTLFLDLHDDKCLGINSNNKKILNMASYKTPLMVFDSADLDSAATNVVEATWGYQGLLPWSVNAVLVQENIFKLFVHKLKSKLRCTKMGLGHNKMVDTAYPSVESFNKLTNLINQAKAQGIDVFQVVEGANTPTLFIGAKVCTNRVISADEYQDAKCVTVLPFRSIDEAVDLANNTRQGLGASVWTENIGVANEVAKKLKVSNVWVNCHGLTLADVTLSPIKDSGMGYFGGREGFYEYVQFKKNSEACNIVVLPTKLVGSVLGFINTAKKAQENWYKIPRIDKGKLLQSFAEYIDSNRKNLSLNLSEKWLENWINNIYLYIITVNNQNCSASQTGFTVTSIREPRGVVAIETKNVDTHNIKLILTSLMEGNSVILLNESEPTQSFYKELSQRLPGGVLTVVPSNLDNVATVAEHKEVNAYFGDGVNPVFAILPVNDSRIFTNVANDGVDVYRKVTFCKNVWANVGKSSTCHL